MDLGAPFRFAGDQINKIPGVKQVQRFLNSPLGKGINRAQSTFDALDMAQAVKEGRYRDALEDALYTFGTIPVETYKGAKAVLATPFVKPAIAATGAVLLDQRPAGGALYGPGTPYKTYKEFV
ncbi:MAG TPA: hypothetical protein DCW74_19430, partial [Alteromonas australica]|nr:hypothetical protein [Alteromonas australica]